MLVELKNGETLNGHLANCDNWMNLILEEVVQTSPEGDRFFRLPEVYVRGNNVRYLHPTPAVLSFQANEHVDQILANPGGNRGDGQGTAAEPAAESQPWWPRGQGR